METTHNRLNDFLIRTADRELDYTSHDCLRWVFLWMSGKEADFPYTNQQEAVQWVIESGGWEKTSDEISKSVSATKSSPECGSVVLYKMKDEYMLGISEDGERHYFLNNPVGYRRIKVPVLEAWNCHKL